MMIKQLVVLWSYFKERHKKLIATDLSKQQKLDAHPEAIQSINFTENLENDAAIFFIIKEAKETVLGFHSFILF